MGSSTASTEDCQIFPVRLDEISQLHFEHGNACTNLGNKFGRHYNEILYVEGKKRLRLLLRQLQSRLGQGGECYFWSSIIMLVGFAMDTVIDASIEASSRR